MSQKRPENANRPGRVEQHIQDSPQPFQRRDVLVAFAIVMITALVFSNSLHNGFVSNWDDGLYVTENPLVKDFSLHGLEKIFTTLHLDYYPVTLFTYACEHALYGLNPAGYHATSLVLHCLNVLLVFWLVRLLTGRIEAAAITALFFGIHPMHVEPVAWISSRKDLLYALFFLASLICYVRYLKSAERNGAAGSSRRRLGFYNATLGLFLLSLLSKSSAASLPLVLVLLDWYVRRTFDRQSLLEKIPFFLFSMIFGVVGIVAQRATGALSLASSLWSPIDRLLFASYAWVVYLAKAVVPTNLSAFYPYPVGAVSFEYSLAPMALIAILAFVLMLRSRERALRFGAGFFLATVVLMLQLVPVGSALVAERYTYVAYIGLFFVVGHYYCRVSDRTGSWHGNATRLFAVVLAAYAVWFSLASHARVTAWSSGTTLLSDALASHPGSAVAQLSRGIGWRKERRTEEALADFNAAIRLDPGLVDAYYNRGLVYTELKQYRSALNDFTTVLRLKPEDASAYAVRGTAFDDLKEYRSALADYTRAIELEPEFAEAYNSRGVSHANLNEFQAAIRDYTRATELNPGYADAFNNRAVSSWRLGDYASAVRDFSVAIRLNGDRTEALYNRGICLSALARQAEAADDFSRILVREPGNLKARYRRFLALTALKRFGEARADLAAYYGMAPNEASMYNDLSILQSQQGRYDSAVASVNRSIALSPKRAAFHVNLGLYQHDLGDRAAARRSFSRAIAIDDTRWAPRLGLAVISLSQADLRNAKLSLVKARGLEPRLRRGLSGIAELESEGYFFSESFKDKLPQLFGLLEAEVP